MSPSEDLPSEDKLGTPPTTDDEKNGVPDPSESIFSVPVAQFCDETYDLVARYGGDICEATPEDEKKVKWKIYVYLISLLLLIDLVLFVDKGGLSQSTLLGLMEETGMSTHQYNNLNTIFYTGYAVGQIPGNYLIQRLPVSLFVTLMITLWSIITFLHCPATSYGGLIPLRFLLGMTESSLVPAMEVTMSMFLEPGELHAVQPVFWASCMGAPIPSGLIAFGLLFVKSPVTPWKFFMIITGGTTLLLAVVAGYWYPANPAKARFLSLEEKIWTIRKVHRATRSSIEQKHFKRYQLVEALKDPISWMFTLSTFLLMLANNLAYQLGLLYTALGVNNKDSTLVWIAAGGFSASCCIMGSILASRFKGLTAYWAAFWCIPSVAGSIGMVAVPWDHKLGLLASLLLAANTFGICYIFTLSWTTSSCAGHTKKLVRNGMFMAAYSVANIIGPQMWNHGTPRYYATWIVQMVLSFFAAPGVLVVVRWILMARNKERRAWQEGERRAGRTGRGWLEQKGKDGEVVRTEVDVCELDLTDLENKWFIYPM